MHSFLKSKFQGFVHRGDASTYIENTLEAFKSADSLGYKYIETDLRETKDGKIITFHDANIKRITGSNVTINRSSLSDIRMRRLPKNESIPTIDEVLEELPDSYFNMDLKVSDMDVLTVDNSHRMLTSIDGALKRVDAERGDLGATMNRMGHTIDNLGNIVVNSSAARSRIEDADMALETAELAKSQILQQAATAMVGQANKAMQTILTLLR